ncbi:MAG: regulatory iron-sulfur-containing complex subunit RicT [Thermodesulfovibrionales bacterium]|jgi:cell fate regulator YaaT (PSP1 superfamily)
MPDVIGIRFRRCGKIYDFEIDTVEGDEVKAGDLMVVESEFGLSIGTVVKARQFVEPGERVFKKVIRRVSDEDIRTKTENKAIEKDARDFCLERIMARGMQMKLVGAEATLDRKRIIFYFTADGRVDFRELVKDLAARFKTRIEMRQIGVRDEARAIGGLGICGREICCSRFLTSFEPVSIKMAKRQDLVLNVGKLSGLCGRLLCCLRYEFDGDLEGLSGDDEMPVSHEEKPAQAAEEKISPAAEARRERMRRPSPERPMREKRTFPPRGEKRPLAQEKPPEKQEPPVEKAAEKPEETAEKRNRDRFRRRRRPPKA